MGDMREQPRWMAIGKKCDLVAGAGVGARAGDRQLALFWLPELDNALFAISNFCPFSGVHIIARGIVGDIGGEPVVASPLYKQHFSLVDGRCLDTPEVALETWPMRFDGDEVQVQLGATAKR